MKKLILLFLALQTLCFGQTRSVLQQNVSPFLTVYPFNGGTLMTNTVPLTSLYQNGATNGQVLSWNGTAWVPVTPTSSGGTVTSVAATVPPWLSVAGSPITGAGTLAFSVATGTNAPSIIGGTNVTVTGVWPNQTISTSGGGGSGSLTNFFFPTTPSWLTAAVTNSTTAPSVALTATSGQTANEVLASPNGSSGAVGLRALVAADVPTLNQNTTGTAASFTGSLVGDVTGTQGATVVSKISSLTNNGFVKTSGGTGALSVDTNSYLTTNSAATLPYLSTNGGAMNGSIAMGTNNISGTGSGTFAGLSVSGPSATYNGVNYEINGTNNFFMGAAPGGTNFFLSSQLSGIVPFNYQDWDHKLTMGIGGGIVTQGFSGTNTGYLIDATGTNSVNWTSRQLDDTNGVALNGIVKASSSGPWSVGVSGTDFAPPTTGNSILYGNGNGGFSNAIVGTGLSFSGGTLTATGGGGSGTVTSVAATAPTGLIWTGSPITTSGTLALSWSGTIPTAQIPALTGDVTSTSGTVATTVVKINGTSLAGLATGLLKNTTSTGIPSIATAGTDYLTPTGSAAGLTAIPGANITAGTVPLTAISTNTATLNYVIAFNGTNAAWTSAGSGSGTINSASQYALPYYSASGSATTISGLAGNTNSTDKVFVSHGTGSAAAIPFLTNAPALSGANFTSATIPNAALVSIPIVSVHVQIFTNSGTYTPTTGMAFAYIEGCGGGGGSGGLGTNVSGAGGSGGGGAAEVGKIWENAAGIGSSQTVTIGAAGAAGAVGANNGGTGGTTSIGTILVLPGGSGGVGRTPGTSQTIAAGGAGGTGGTGSSGAILSPGSPGGNAAYSPATGGWSGIGGSGPYGGGGLGLTINGTPTGTFPGNPGQGFGAGGGGSAAYTASSSIAGAAGSAGIIIVTDYCTQ